jgi:hypothetical protein
MTDTFWRLALLMMHFTQQSDLTRESVMILFHPFLERILRAGIIRLAYSTGSV